MHIGDGRSRNIAGSGYSRLETELSSAFYNSDDVTLMSFSMGNSPNMDELELLATNASLVVPAITANVDKAVNAIKDKSHVCVTTSSTSTYSSTTSTSTASTISTTETTTSTSTVCSNRVADVVFVLDTSPSILTLCQAETRLGLTISIMRELVSRLSPYLNRCDSLILILLVFNFQRSAGMKCGLLLSHSALLLS